MLTRPKQLTIAWEAADDGFDDDGDDEDSIYVTLTLSSKPLTYTN